MTRQRDLKNRIRARMTQTGESYTTARAAILLAGGTLPDTKPDPIATPAIPNDPVDVLVLAGNDRSVRVRIPGEVEQIDFKTGDVFRLAPGLVATIRFENMWRGRYLCGSGKVLATRIDLDAWGLPPLPLNEIGMSDFGSYEPWIKGDPSYAVLRRAMRRPRMVYEMDPIAWDSVAAASDEPLDDPPTIMAAELREAGDPSGARRLLMQALKVDLRCIDAHVALGNMIFDSRPEDAEVHYEIARLVGERSLGDAFDGVLLWGHLYNRPFLRALHGLGLVQWRSGRTREARATFERILMLNPTDNQGVRFCLEDVERGREWSADT